MRILLDECVHAAVRTAFPNHSVRTVSEMGWRGIPDAQLIAIADGKCDVLVTIDRSIEREAQLSRIGFGVVIAHVSSNRLVAYQPVFEDLLRAVETVKPGELVHVFGPRRKRG